MHSSRLDIEQRQVLFHRVDRNTHVKLIYFSKFV